MWRENRIEYRSITPNAGVFFRHDAMPAGDQRYLAGVAEDVSLGGLFIACRHPPRPGAVISLQLFSPADPSDSSAVRARGIVRWRQLWHEPRGMGVQLLDFAGLGQRKLASWLDTITMAPPFHPALAAAPVPAHQH